MVHCVYRKCKINGGTLVTLLCYLQIWFISACPTVRKMGYTTAPKIAENVLKL